MAGGGLIIAAPWLFTAGLGVIGCRLMRTAIGDGVQLRSGQTRAPARTRPAGPSPSLSGGQPGGTRSWPVTSRLASVRVLPGLARAGAP